MANNDWLDARRRELVPTDSEIKEVQDARDVVCSAVRSIFRTAEVRPCGSAAKGTMLRGRKEADLVLIMRDAPTSQTLENIQNTMGSCPGVRDARIRHKAVAVQFQNGVSVDVLPAARDGLTEWGGSIPSKHRRALDGPAHVDWFLTQGQATGANDVVRLIKHWRDVHGLSGVLSSFGLEILTVNTLQGRSWRNIEEKLSAVLRRLSAGQIQVQDPVRPSAWVNDVGSDNATRVQRAASASLEFLNKGQPSSAFAGPGYPSNLEGIGRTPLA